MPRRNGAFVSFPTCGTRIAGIFGKQQQIVEKSRVHMQNIKESVAVITGGASSIGLALGRYWAQRGGKVVIGDIAEEALARAKAEIGGDAVTVPCDVTSEEDMARLADTATDSAG
jgi:hypothetical protein